MQNDDYEEYDLFGFHFDEKRFQNEYQRWTNQNIQNYSFIMVDHEVPQRYTVGGGTMIKREVLDGYYDAYADPDNKYSWQIEMNSLRGVSKRDVSTLSELYGCLEKEAKNIKQRYDSGELDRVDIDIAYDPVSHFPASWEFTGYTYVGVDNEENLPMFSSFKELGGVQIRDFLRMNQPLD
jgi:hypothetical protein